MFFSNLSSLRIEVSGRIWRHEENAETILSLLDAKSGEVSIKVIPAGFELVQRPVVLDADTLGSLPARKLYCTGRVLVDRDVDGSALDEALDAITSEDIIICPAAQRGVMAGKCDPLKNRVLFYEGELWLVEDEEELTPSRFEYLDGQATLVVSGELRVAEDVEPDVLAGRLHRVHNLGEISCTTTQMGAIQARLGLKDGELVDSAQPDQQPDNKELDMGNMGYLAL